MQIIQIDTRQKLNKHHHIAKEKYFESVGYKIVRSKCLVGDYCFPNNGSISVDTKQSIGELYQDLVQDHDRFKRECILAQECGIKLHVLVENKECFRKVEQIKLWKNPLMFAYLKRKNLAIKNHEKPPKPPVSNIQLIKMMSTMEKEYGVEFHFCPIKDAGKMVLQLLNGNNE